MKQKPEDQFSDTQDSSRFSEETRKTSSRQGKTRRIRPRPDSGSAPFSSLENTQPSRAADHGYSPDSFQPLQPVHIQPPQEPAAIEPPRRRRGCGCRTLLLLALPALLFYLLFPFRTNLLVLGLDRALAGTDASRTDTNILISVIPLEPTVNMLSIPRDLWVPISGVGENRINTAHYFAELAQPGSGPDAAIKAVESNFGVTVHHYIRIRFDGLQQMIDSMGGVTIDLPAAMSGYGAGEHLLNGKQALAFARDRAGSDDFSRMQRGQLLITAVLKKLASPASWVYLPSVFSAAWQSMDTDIPLWQMPRLGMALFRAALGSSINAQTITRDMVTPWTTSEGANVLLPNWDAINPLLLEMFGQ